MNIIDNIFGLWWVAVWSTAAASCTLVSAWRGEQSLRVPRSMLGVAVAAIAFSYWWDIGSSDTFMVPAEMRRGAGIVLWPALLWAVKAQVKHRETQAATLNEIVGSDR